MQKFSESEIETSLAGTPEWSEVSGKIQRTFQFDDFRAAMAFVNQVADIAEAQDHHPDILIRYNRVTLSLSTHDAGGITEKDFTQARDADGLVSA